MFYVIVQPGLGWHCHRPRWSFVLKVDIVHRLK